MGQLFRWSRIEHPRFGLICSIVAITEILVGEEVFVNYGLGMSEAATWYKLLWVDHLRKHQGICDNEINAWCSRMYSINGRYIQLPLG